jgi:DNA-binding transcriptional MerR regulator
MTTYTTATAAKAAGISSATLRNYTRDPRLIPHFSATATTTPRQLTTDDVKTLRYIAAQTAAGRTLQDVAADLDAGQHLDAPTWSAPEPDQQRSPEQTQLIDSAMMTMLATLRDEFAAARAHADQLQDQLISAERRAAAAEAQLAQLQTRKTFWQRLTGR